MPGERFQVVAQGGKTQGSPGIYISWDVVSGEPKATIHHRDDYQKGESHIETEPQISTGSPQESSAEH